MSFIYDKVIVFWRTQICVRVSRESLVYTALYTSERLADPFKDLKIFAGNSAMSFNNVAQNIRQAGNSNLAETSARL